MFGVPRLNPTELSFNRTTVELKLSTQVRLDTTDGLLLIEPLWN